MARQYPRTTCSPDCADRAGAGPGRRGDRRWPHADAVLVVHSSSLLVALRGLFDAIWRTSVPVATGASGDDTDPDDRRLLTYLAAGMTDDAISRQLGWHLRTVQRRVRRLMGELGVRTRFQAGLHAARRGWLQVCLSPVAMGFRPGPPGHRQ
ncbi:helix-turn-helix transcriptional regulator [Micromonospora sp. NPDC050200]|uniref:helix-turn-helix transcriptional regulator n=1 Tax=Micromonospora sp. NPDC050200 TaxID=3155664 RepID=UPI0033C1708C